MENSTSNPIELLQTHFKKFSQLNNHSLDTYLLENILKNRFLFLIPGEDISLNTMESRIELRQFITKQEVISKAEYAYRVAKLYEENNQPEKAYAYYASAMQHGHDEAYELLSHLATNGDSEAQYALGIAYHSMNQFHEAIDWFIQAGRQQYSPAIAYLFETKFSAEHYLLIARKYQQENNIAAVTFYEKAYHLNNKEAAFCLGQFSDPLVKTEIASFEKNGGKAFNYYLTAVRQKDESALEAMVKLAEHFTDNNYLFKLGQIYLEVFANHSLALTYFKNLAANNFANILNQLNQLSENPEYSFIAAKLYEDAVKIENYQQEMCFHYAVAAQHDHELALETLKQLAVSGNPEAQYFLGFAYYHHKGNVDEAINWCMRAAEQQHLEAISYLSENKFSSQQYLMIAQQYDDGISVRKNEASALFFYEKACALNNAQAAFRLGQFYQIDHEGIPKDIITAFNTYLHAAQLGNQDALEPLESLGEEVGAKEQRALGAVYETFFRKQEKALHWRNKAIETEQFNIKM